MTYGRLVTKDIFIDPAFSEMSEGAQLWALKLLVLADDFGRGYGGQLYLRKILGLDDAADLGEIKRRTEELGQHGIIEFFEHEGHKYHYFPHWFAIQRFNSNCHPKPTRIPNPPNLAKAYVRGCLKLCRVMLKRKAHDPDAYTDVTILFDAGWEDRDEKDDHND